MDLNQAPPAPAEAPIQAPAPANDFRVIGVAAAGSQAATAPTPLPAPAEVVAPAPVETPATNVAEPATAPSAYQQLGLEENDFTKRVLAAAKTPEDFAAMAKLYSTDYNTMDPSALLRLEIRKEYPTLSPEQVETQLKLKLRNEFNQGEENEEDVRNLGTAKLEALANRIRDERKQEQSSWQPTAPVAPDPEASRAGIDAMLSADQFVTAFETNGVITIGEGADAFNYAVADPKKVRDFAYDYGSLVNAAVQDAAGKLDGKRFTKAAAFLSDMDGYDKALIAHYTSQAESREFNRGYNASVPTGTGAPAPNANDFKVIGRTPGRGH